MNQLLEFGTLCVLLLNVGTAYSRTKLVRVTGFSKLEEYIVKYDALVAWVCATAAYIAMIGKGFTS